MKEVILLTNYKGQFGSKYNSIPYRSGLNLGQLSDHFKSLDLKLTISAYNDIKLDPDLVKGRVFIHDSIEDRHYRYKSYMEDIALSLEQAGAVVIPGHRFIRSHNNKVYMEFLRSLYPVPGDPFLKASHYGSKEEFMRKAPDLNYPLVIKSAEDAQGRGVFLGTDRKTAVRLVSKVSRSIEYISEWLDVVRQSRHRDYTRESRHRNKFIVQNLIPGLKNDWKILIFHDLIYILRRGVPDGDFRASGSKYDYGFGTSSTPPPGIFDYAMTFYQAFNVPYISLDIAWDGQNFHTLEFQFVSFGSSTQSKSDCYFRKKEGEWIPQSEKLELEYLYAYSVKSHLMKNQLLER